MLAKMRKQFILAREMQDRRPVRPGDIDHVCPRCGSRNLTWAFYKEKWRMYDLDMKHPHICGSVGTIDDFDVC